MRQPSSSLSCLSLFVQTLQNGQFLGPSCLYYLSKERSNTLDQSPWKRKHKCQGLPSVNKKKNVTLLAMKVECYLNTAQFPDSDVKEEQSAHSCWSRDSIETWPKNVSATHHTHGHTHERERERQRERDIDRDRQREIERDRQTDRELCWCIQCPTHCPNENLTLLSPKRR